MEDYDEINIKHEGSFEDTVTQEEKGKNNKIGLLLKMIAIPFVAYFVFFVIASIVLIFGGYNGN